jgi:hypothetical protein
MEEVVYEEKQKDEIFTVHYIHEYLLLGRRGDKLREDGVGGACRTNGADVKCVQHFSRKTRREVVTCEACVVSRSVVLK